jgi:hypothetical protein
MAESTVKVPGTVLSTGMLPKFRAVAPFFCSTKQLSFFLWSRLRVKERFSFPHQISVALLINSLPVSRGNVVSDGVPKPGRGR